MASDFFDELIGYAQCAVRRRLMPVIAGLGWTFDTVADDYALLRPGYVDEMYEYMFDAAHIGAGSRAVEVGIGGGQATLPVLKTGCAVTAVEPGGNFCALCREKFSEYPGFNVINGKFEDVPFEDDAYDLVYSASAFHWVPEEVGYRKAFAMLRSGGVFARFANHPYADKGRPELDAEIQNLYARYMPHSKRSPEYDMAQARERADIALRYGFRDAKCALFMRTRSFTAAQYTRLLGTYSDHIALDKPVREEFFLGIERAIDRHGGVLTMYDTIDIELAIKP